MIFGPSTQLLRPGAPGGVPGAGDPASSERTPRDGADALVGEQTDHLPLFLPLQEAVLVLHRDEAGQPCRSAACCMVANCHAHIDDAPR